MPPRDGAVVKYPGYDGHVPVQNIESITSHVVDVRKGEIVAATVVVNNGRIAEIRRAPDSAPATYLIPGFVDGHLHVESAMLPPPEFARLAMPHGTVAVVADPHEIGNVLGIEGVRYMLDSGERSPMKFYFGAPSCVPATPFETAGGRIDARELDDLFADPRIRFLSEMMNWPGVLAGDAAVMAKLDIARKRGKLVDGHAPGLKGDDARAYAAAGITTDHECMALDEAFDKLAAGMLIGIREGSAAKNLDTLMALIGSHAERCFLCTDDSHPDDLVKGHIDVMVRRAVHAGHDPMRVLHSACVTPVDHYGLEVGLLQPGDPADFVEIDNLEAFTVLRTVIDGAVVAERGQALVPAVSLPLVNQFNATPKSVADFRVAPQGTSIRVIEAREGQLITGAIEAPARIEDDNVVSDVDRDVLKITVVSRYSDAPPACAFIKNLGLGRGAMASSVAHDSHNIVAVGATDQTLCQAVNAVINARGGLAVVDEHGACDVLPLPIAGLMSDGEGTAVARDYARLTRKVKELGCTLRSPLMTLSFMALLVIPDLKLSDKGLFSGRSFQFIDIFA